MANHFLELAKKPADFTYVGIGTNPHAATVAELNDFWDQLMPVFVRDQLHKTVRVFHFDPAFEYKMNFIKEYYATKYPELVYSQQSGYHGWFSPRLEVYLAPVVLMRKSDYNPDGADDEFLSSLSNIIVDQGTQIVVQDFSGQDLQAPFKAAYEASTNKPVFKRKVLFDITYGNASCMTDLTKYKPIYDRHGNFVNFTLFTASEIEQAIGHDKRLDELAAKHFVAKFKSTLSFHHGNYRRRINGDICFVKTEYYDGMAAPDLIMGVLQHELTALFAILKRLGLTTVEKENQFTDLMLNYASINMYDWNTHLNKMF
jgi:hypothetical protein